MQMTGGRAERLHWNENGTAWTTWRQNVSRVQRAQARDAIQMPLSAAVEMFIPRVGVSITGCKGRGRGREGSVGL